MKSKIPKLRTAGEGIKAIINKVFDNPYKKIGISWLSLRKLKYFSKSGLNSHKLFGHQTFYYERVEYLYALKEIFVDEIYLQRFSHNSYIIDCGAHIGISVIFFKKLCSSAKVVAFEPDLKNYEVLKQNVASHNFENVELRNEAVWTSDTTISFVSEGNMSSKIVAVKNATTQVQARRLRSFLNVNVDFLKLDIEGAEFEVLKDIQDKLFLVKNLFIEYHGFFSQNNELNILLQSVSNEGFHYYIKEATPIYKHPFLRSEVQSSYEVQLNIFCFRLDY